MEVKMTEKPIDELDIIERYIITVLGVHNKPISIKNLEQIIYQLTEKSPTIKMILNLHFDENQKSIDIRELVEDPFHYFGAWEFENKKLILTDYGKELFKEINNLYGTDERFPRLIKLIHETRL